MGVGKSLNLVQTSTAVFVELQVKNFSFISSTFNEGQLYI
jgi:hypothetical protein